MDVWLPISRFSVLADLPEPTLRRYLKNFESYFKLRKEKRLSLLHHENIDLAKKIYALSCQGKSMSEIDVIISNEYSKIFDIDEDAKNVVICEEKTVDMARASGGEFGKLIVCMEKMILNQDLMIQQMQKQNEILMKLLIGTETGGKKLLERQVVPRSEIINAVESLYKQGYGKNKIAKILNETGISTVSGKGKWSPSSVARLKKEIGTQEINHD